MKPCIRRQALLLGMLIVVSTTVFVDRATAQFTLRSSSDPLTLEQIINLGVEDLNDFWTQELNRGGWTYTAPTNLYSYDSNVQTSCGPALLGNAFYCPADHSVYYDVNLMGRVFSNQEFNDFGALTVLAHEWSHAVQVQFPDEYQLVLTRDRELQADCLAGTYSGYLQAGRSTRLQLEEGDLEEGATFLYSLGDDLPWFDEKAHGSPYERSLNFVIGLAEGIEACFPNLYYSDPGGVFSISLPQSWHVQNDARWSEDGATYYKWFMMSPQQAEQAEIHGYLSEGIRITISMPQRGRVWTDTYQSSWVDDLPSNVLRNNPGFSVTGQNTVSLGPYTGTRYWFEGDDIRISEPEKTSFIVIAQPQFLMQIELASPVSGFDYYLHRLDDLVSTLSVQNPVAPQ